MYLNFDNMSPHFARFMSSMFYYYGLRRTLNSKTILIPKLPIQVPWKSGIFITLFFSISGFYVYQFVTFYMMLSHLYVYCLCIEYSIYYYTKEFHLFSRWPGHYNTDFTRIVKTTVYRNSKKL
ncbi:hypothetical protein CRE_02989 [Caenorhabditis remanei]|uniref:Uncharacterized protein n=1 Tax=Caenorhabditis remanei TaxID=31234 RepID=E3LX26_CAERE|nr:hypothetical protein CRE_02989 [Caenorhabditis remanei]